MALPGLSPKPLIVHSICLAPFRNWLLNGRDAYRLTLNSLWVLGRILPGLLPLLLVLLHSFFLFLFSPFFLGGLLNSHLVFLGRNSIRFKVPGFPIYRGLPLYSSFRKFPIIPLSFPRIPFTRLNFPNLSSYQISTKD